MPKKCEVCNKTPKMERGRKKLMSKYNPTPKRKKQPNLQKTFIPFDIPAKKLRDFAGKKVVACTKCIKTMGKNE